MGPLATRQQLDRIQDAVGASVGQGAELLSGGRVPPDFETGWYYEPTILACPHQDIRTVQEEMFGPVLSALRFGEEAWAEVECS